MRPPARPPEAVEADGYTALIAAVISRALADAQGPCRSHRPGTPEPPRPEAKTWLQDEAAVAGFLELGGYDAAPVLEPLRAWYYREPVRGPLDGPPEPQDVWAHKQGGRP